MSVVAAMAIGLAGGIAAGLMGIGGGLLFIPALAIFLDKTQIEAEGTALVAIVPVALVGAWRQARFGNVRVREGISIGLLSPLGVLAGAAVANALSQRSLEVVFALLILVFAGRLAVAAFRQAPEGPPTKPTLARRTIEVD